MTELSKSDLTCTAIRMLYKYCLVLCALKYKFYTVYRIHYFVVNVGLRVIEVAHDIQSQVGKYVSTDLRLVNSYDTWHGKGLRNHCMCMFQSTSFFRNKECCQTNE